MVVGASAGDGVIRDSGAAYVFERDTSGQWLQADKLIASDLVASDRLGEAVAADGDRLVVGAPGGSNGVVYVFELSIPCGDLQSFETLPVEVKGLPSADGRRNRCLLPPLHARGAASWCLAAWVLRCIAPQRDAECLLDACSALAEGVSERVYPGPKLLLENDLAGAQGRN